jgi:hypothetical protein
MQEGEIFESLGKFLEKHLPKKLHQPVFECNVCMTPWYGSVMYWIIYGHGWEDWLFTIFMAMGLQIVLNKLAPHKPKKNGANNGNTKGKSEEKRITEDSDRPDQDQ